MKKCTGIKNHTGMKKCTRIKRDTSMKNYTDINAKTIDHWVEKKWEWGIPITHDDYTKAQKGEWNVLLTPVKHVPREWLPDLKNKKKKYFSDRSFHD